MYEGYIRYFPIVHSLIRNGIDNYLLLTWDRCLYMLCEYRVRFLDNLHISFDLSQPEYLTHNVHTCEKLDSYSRRK